MTERVQKSSNARLHALFIYLSLGYLLIFNTRLSARRCPGLYYCLKI